MLADMNALPILGLAGLLALIVMGALAVVRRHLAEWGQRLETVELQARESDGALHAEVDRLRSAVTALTRLSAMLLTPPLDGNHLDPIAVATLLLEGKLPQGFNDAILDVKAIQHMARASVPPAPAPTGAHEESTWWPDLDAVAQFAQGVKDMRPAIERLSVLFPAPAALLTALESELLKIRERLCQLVAAGDTGNSKLVAVIQNDWSRITRLYEALQREMRIADSGRRPGREE